jgi:hypothetical protein
MQELGEKSLIKQKNYDQNIIMPKINELIKKVIEHER